MKYQILVLNVTIIIVICFSDQLMLVKTSENQQSDYSQEIESLIKSGMRNRQFNGLISYVFLFSSRPFPRIEKQVETKN